MPDCPTQPWSLPAWARTTPRTCPSSAQMLYSATVAIPAGSAIDTAKSLESLRTHLPIPSRACSIRLPSTPARPQWTPCARVVLPQLAGRFPQAGPVPRGGRGSQIGSHPVDQRFGRRLAGMRMSAARIRVLAIFRTLSRNGNICASPVACLAAPSTQIHVLHQRSLRRRPINTPREDAGRGHVTINTCQVSGFVQRTAANPARSGRKQR